MKQRILRVLPKVAFFVILLVLCVAGMRGEPVPQVFENQDKLHHWAGFACLTVSAYLAFPGTRLIWLLLWPLVGSMLIELEQSFMPLRSASWGDMLANATGVLCGMVAIFVLRGYQNSKLRTSAPVGAAKR
ncbi:VanZ family protein [Pseudomonas vancouverensis]|uniref:VanZ family protein n=1 Tax=Pseudomonas vancouverensis TaxID=95300 RepID=A0A1H2MQ17_PSEVA|nr:VanZ family protein [Pseudomonas vancouverensis]KAB0494594.1 VanZ family protein [Pseudomonas vancouverensis]TDB59260.1 VanZ family protein [Pseudomonas vancouverensis]SDU95075.1 VanZ like family protein [Pseudomonas vancouverensis]